MKRLLELSHEDQTLLDMIPGGVIQCRNERDFTITGANEGFLNMLGFTREELAEKFHNRYFDMIHPSDRQNFLTELDRQFMKGERFSLSYRVVCKDGDYKWIASSAKRFGAESEKRLLCVLMDLSEVQDAQEKLRLSLEHLQIIMRQTSDIFFEWNMIEDTITYSPNWLDKFGYPPQYDGKKEKEEIYRHFHPDDIDTMDSFMGELRKGIPDLTADVRIRNAEGQYIWCRIHAADQYGTDDRPIRAVGTISDIDKEKRMLEDLRKRAELDALTGLYNHAEMERRTKLYLKNNSGELCALFIIDVDDFKNVNDGQGHLFGDAVLAELAAGMKSLARKTDLIGRIGGDEFAMFLKNIPSVEVAEEKAKKLIETFQNLFQEEKRPIEVTCSIGLALCPMDGGDYQSLYHCADLALYQAKSRGKNQYARFDVQSMEAMDRIGYSSLGAAIDSDQKASGQNGDLVNYVFQILYDSNDIDITIETIMEIVGRRFDVSRVYVFENSDNGKYTSNTYEWCNDEIDPQKEFLQHFPYEEVKGYQDLFQENSIFYCRDIHSLTPEQTMLFESQNVRSTLQCAFYDEDTFRGFIGFDECTGLRMWNKEEIGTLSLIAQILTTFLLKKREADRNRQMMIQLNTILDTQDAYIYAITQDTYELLYLNRKTMELAPSASIGMTCHKAFFGRDIPCEDCPLSGSSEIYNPQYKVWTKAQVSEIRWKESNAYLLTCFDITGYKKVST